MFSYVPKKTNLKIYGLIFRFYMQINQNFDFFYKIEPKLWGLDANSSPFSFIEQNIALHQPQLIWVNVKLSFSLSHLFPSLVFIVSFCLVFILIGSDWLLVGSLLRFNCDFLVNATEIQAFLVLSSPKAFKFPVPNKLLLMICRDHFFGYSFFVGCVHWSESMLV